MTNVVSLVRASSANIKNSIAQALTLIDFDLRKPVKTVVIKPNLCYYWASATGQTTDPQVVSAIVDAVREIYGEDVNIRVAEADASAMRTKYVFNCLGYEELSLKKEVELLNLSSDELIEKTVSVGERQMSFLVPQQLLSCDLFINVPKLKYMRETKITCAMKNVFGCIGFPRKAKYHPYLNEAIVGINKILHPHLTIVDGLVGLGKLPTKLGLIMAGTDTFSVDCIASRLLGYKPSSVKCLAIARREKLGLSFEVTSRGEAVEEYAGLISTQNSIIPQKYKWGLQLAVLKLYQRLSGDIIPPALEG